MLLVGGQVFQQIFQRYLLGLDGRVAKDPRFERLPCTHKGTYADDCLVQRVQMVNYVPTIPCARRFVQFEHICPDSFLFRVHILLTFYVFGSCISGTEQGCHFPGSTSAT